MGNREAISKMHNMSAAVLTSVITLIDEYDLYGQVAYPKHHKHSEVPDIYRLAARTKVFSFPLGLNPIIWGAYLLLLIYLVLAYKVVHLRIDTYIKHSNKREDHFIS